MVYRTSHSLQLLVSFLIICGVVLAGESVDYEDFSTWHGVCHTGLQQSPININDMDTIDCSKAKFNIQFWNGNTVINPSTGAGSNLLSPYPTSVITMVDPDGKLAQYNSAQFHLHTPSEHTINGAYGDLEIHFVHKLNAMVFENSRTYSVFGILFKEVPDNADVTTVFDSIDFTQPNQTTNFNTTFQMVEDQAVFYYPGSFTTPNCDELVHWFVFQKFLPIRTSQLAKIKSSINSGKSNNRPVQALNTRKVTLVTPKCMNSFPIVGVLVVKMAWRAVVGVCLIISFMFL